jgi:hypothetical protein
MKNMLNPKKYIGIYKSTLRQFWIADFYGDWIWIEQDLTILHKYGSEKVFKKNMLCLMFHIQL